MVNPEGSTTPTITWKSLQWPFVFVYLLIIGASAILLFFWISYVNRFQASHCPQDTFMVGLKASILILIPQFLFIFGAIGTIVLLFLRMFPAVPRVFDAYEATSEKIYFHNIQFGLVVVMVIAGSVSALLVPGQLNSRFCLATSGIYNQTGASGGLHHYNWGDVESVRTTCVEGKGGWAGSFYMSLRDGTSIDITSMTANGSWVPYYPMVARSLHGNSFAFDTSGVEPGCKADELTILKTRP